MASTNLVLELTIIMVALLGWQLTLAEIVGAPLMVVLLVLLFRMFLSRDLLAQAKKHADKGLVGRMEGACRNGHVRHGRRIAMAADDIRPRSHRHQPLFCDAVWLDIVGGLLIAGALSAWVPNTFWQSFFLTGHPVLATLWDQSSARSSR